MEKKTTNSLETLVQYKEKRLPRSVRAHIRQLKEQGKVEEAIRFAEEHRKKSKPILRAEDRLNLAVGNILTEEDPKIIATESLAITWILSRKNVITPEERVTDINSIYDLFPEASTHLEAVATTVVKEVTRLSYN